MSHDGTGIDVAQLYEQIHALREERDAISLAHEKTQRELETTRHEFATLRATLRPSLESLLASAEERGVLWAVHYMRHRFFTEAARPVGGWYGLLTDPGVQALFCTAIPDILQLGRADKIDTKPKPGPVGGQSGVSRGLEFAIQLTKERARRAREFGLRQAEDAYEAVVIELKKARGDKEG